MKYTLKKFLDSAFVISAKENKPKPSPPVDEKPKPRTEETSPKPET